MDFHVAMAQFIVEKMQTSYLQNVKAAWFMRLVQRKKLKCTENGMKFLENRSSNKPSLLIVMYSFCKTIHYCKFILKTFLHLPKI